MPREITPNLLLNFMPMDGLKSQNLRALCRKTSIRTLGEGRILITEGEQEKLAFYLISGELELHTDGQENEIIKAGDPIAKRALLPHLPRQKTAIAKTDIEYLAIDSDLLDVMLTWDQTCSYDVADHGTGEDEQDWLSTLLRTKAFHRVPAANIQTIISRMQQQPYKAGEVIIKQGDDGKNNYHHPLV